MKLKRLSERKTTNILLRVKDKRDFRMVLNAAAKRGLAIGTYVRMVVVEAARKEMQQTGQ